MPTVEGLVGEERKDLGKEGDPSGIFMLEDECWGLLPVFWGPIN